MQNLLNSLIKHISIISAFIIFSSLLKLYIYFKLFNIAIINFIDLSESVILFIDNLLAYFAIFVVTLLVTTLLRLEDNLLSKEKEERVSFFKKFWQFVKSNITLFLLLSILSVGAFLYYFLRKDIYFYEFLIISGFLWIFYFITPYLLFTYKSKFAFKIEFQSLLLILILASMSIYGILGAWNEYHKVKEKKFYSTTEFIIEGKLIKSSITNYYIGKTKEFVFFYDQANKTATVIPVEKVDRYIFK